MSALTRAVSITLEVDPELLPDQRPGTRERMTLNWSRGMRLRLLPCKGGVAVIRGGRGLPPSKRSMMGEAPEVHATPDSLARELRFIALYHAVAAGELCPGTATWRYREDKARFYACAATAVLEDSRCLRMWGIS